MPAASNQRTLARWLGTEGDGHQRLLGDLTADSRRVQGGDVFVALPGLNHDGREFVADAVTRGAAAVLVERGALTPALRGLPVPVVEVVDLSQRVAELAAAFYDRQGTGLALIGITGTNGKTTVSCLLAQLLSALGRPCAMLGTLGWGFEGELRETGMTTPDAVSIARIVGELGERGAEAIAMEVSSHGLAQRRTAGLDFCAALFTNLSQDHLDYHANMAAYGEAKRRLFLQSDASCVFNIDDEFGQRLFADREITAPKWSYSLTNPQAHVHCPAIEYCVSGSRATLVTPWGEGELACPLPGDFNLLNMLACVTLLGAWDYPLPVLLPLLASVHGAPGRMELVRNRGTMVVVDYAHTPDALHKALQALRRHAAGRLWVVVGCGGNRDRGKRPRMGEVATTLADVVVFTSDNPRDEDPAAILADMTAELPAEAAARMVLEVDRQRAIYQALREASAGDVVVIAGKGHEDYQEILGQRLPFSDRACVEQFYAARETRS